MAENVNKQLEDVGYLNLGIEERPNLIVLNSTRMPAVLIEAGFINSMADNEIFDTRFYETANAIAAGISESFR